MIENEPLSGEHSVIVIDNGSSGVEAGLAGDDEPSIRINSDKSDLPRREANHWTDIWNCHGDRYVNQIAMYPVEQGLITNWDDMEFIWNHIFHNRLQIAPEDHPVLMTEVPLIQAHCREKMTETMFETFTVPAFYTANTGPLGLFSAGRETGIAIDIGEGVTSIVTCYEGYSLPHATQIFDINGAYITNQLADVLSKQGCSFANEDNMKIVRELKEKFCSVLLDCENELKNSIPEEYELPNGEVIKIGRERFLIPEIIFDSKDIEKEFKGNF